jgi:hypothetical protein
MQAGFAQNEMAAATYTVAANEFPIKINLAEIILATSGATQLTTTRWSMLFYSGRPNTGQLVATYTADDVILPYARVGPGTTGVVIQFSIDPNDPEQLFIPAPADGSNTFTFAFRIDQHNNQTANPCFTAPPTASNAFPCTDVSGLQFGAANWLFGVNCGSFGCPPNGGWSTFAGLNTLCRPSGDWVMRATWSGVNCTPGVGACCLPNGTCEPMTVTTCSAAGGSFQGDGTQCGSVTCPQPVGACCFSNNNCLSFTSADCGLAGGVWLGAGSQCSGGSCPQGACCLPNGNCLASVTSQDCTAAGGVFQGPNVTCAAANCPQPTGACCLSNGNCLNLTAANCAAIGSATWAGMGTTCAGGACNPQACYPNCDQSTAVPFLNVQDFACFLNAFAGSQSYANCDNSTTAPTLNVQDFACFLNKFAAGCSAP